MAEVQETQEQVPANRHDTCMRADRGALAQMDRPSRQLLLRCPISCIPAVVGNCSCVVLHMDVRMPRAQDALERPLPPASLQSLQGSATKSCAQTGVVTVVPIDQRCLNSP
jgi:hypothetical protein